MLSFKKMICWKILKMDGSTERERCQDTPISMNFLSNQIAKTNLLLAVGRLAMMRLDYFLCTKT